MGSFLVVLGFFFGETFEEASTVPLHSKVLGFLLFSPRFLKCL